MFRAIFRPSSGACGVMPPDCCRSEAWIAAARTLCYSILHTEKMARAAAINASDR